VASFVARVAKRLTSPHRLKRLTSASAAPFTARKPGAVVRACGAELLRGRADYVGMYSIPKFRFENRERTDSSKSDCREIGTGLGPARQRAKRAKLPSTRGLSADRFFPPADRGKTPNSSVRYPSGGGLSEDFRGSTLAIGLLRREDRSTTMPHWAMFMQSVAELGRQSTTLLPVLLLTALAYGPVLPLGQLECQRAF